MKIGLLDHMGYGNLGDAAIQEAVIASIRKRLPNAELVAFSLIPDDTTKRHGIPCHPILRWHPKPVKTERTPADSVRLKSRLKSVWKRIPLVYSLTKPVLELVREIAFLARSYWALRGLDLLIISGGGQLGELWRGPWAHPYTIFKFCLLTKCARKRLYFLNVGAGPLKHPLSRFFVRWAVRFADYRSFRDHDSQELIRGLGVEGQTHVYPDPAYALKVGDHLKNGSGTSVMPIVGLNPIGFCDPRLWPRKDDSVYNAYLEKLTRFSMWLLEQGYNLRVLTTELSVDRYAVEDLKTCLCSRVSSPELLRLTFPSASGSVTEVLQQMSELDFVVTSKFHGIIFSHLLSKPVISLSYHRKMDAAMRGVGQGHFCADIESFGVDWLIDAFRSLVNESKVIKLGSAKAVQTNAAALSRQFDTLFLPNKP
jgi:polysaccharide pyruvyl transferase WcaK-like protein